MGDFIAVTFALLSIFLIHGASSSYPVGDIRNCPTEQTVSPGSPLLKIDAIPGHGFDNLRNIELGQVYSRNYSSCQVSNDGRYFLPDNINLIPVHESEIDTFVEVFKHYSEHTSSTSVSINAEASASCVFAHASGKFSAEYQNTKQKMVSTNLNSVRFGVRHHLFSVHVNPVSQLHPSFKSRLMDLAAHIQNNDTQMAHYLSDLIVRDYGTHVVMSIEIGGTLYQTSFVAKESIVESDHMQLSVEASDSIKAGFIATFSASSSFGWSRSSSSNSGTNNAIYHVHTSTRGGPPFNIYGFNYTEWQNELPNNLVAIDRRGHLLSFAMTSENFPELPDVLLTKTSDYIYKSIERYYKTNTIKGCTKTDSKNFNFHANLDDNSCEKEKQNYTFGGIYQTCEDHDNNEICDYYKARQTNPLTFDYSCPEGYESILLHTGTLSKMIQSTISFKRKTDCKSYIVYTHCKWTTATSIQTKVYFSTYKAYWCYAPPGKQSDAGYMFGGLYTSKTPNPVTHTSRCPPFYDTLHFGEDINICASRDEQAEDSAIPFGGFYSCMSGNPLAITQDMYQKLASNNQLEYGSSFPTECSHHYNQFLITIDEGCIVNYCSQFQDAKVYSPRPPLVPPYKMKPPMTVNKTESLVIFGPYGKIWVKDDDGSWFEFKNDSVSGPDYLQSLVVKEEDIVTPTELPTNTTVSDDTTSSDSSPSNSYYTGGEVAGIVIGSIFSTALCVAFIAAVGCGVKKYKKKRIARKEAVLYLDKSETGENETAVLVQKLQDQD